MLIDEPRLTITEAADRCGVHRDTVERWIVSGVRGRKLRQVYVGGRRFVLVSDLEDFINKGNRNEQ